MKNARRAWPANQRIRRWTQVALLLMVTPLLSSCEFMGDFFGGVDSTSLTVTSTFVVPIDWTMPSQDVIDAITAEGGEKVVVLESQVQNVDLAVLDSELGRLAGTIRFVRVDAVIHSITANTIDQATQPMDIRIGTVDSSFAEAEPLGFTQDIAAFSVGELSVRINEVGRARASTLMEGLSFTVQSQANFIVEQLYLSNEGTATSQLQFELTVTYGPAND